MRQRCDYDPNIKRYLKMLLEERLESGVCELCEKSASKLVLHHTKYDGATLYDLLCICKSCNSL